jgi:hypothetical protein
MYGKIQRDRVTNGAPFPAARAHLDANRWLTGGGMLTQPGNGVTQGILQAVIKGIEWGCASK